MAVLQKYFKSGLYLPSFSRTLISGGTIQGQRYLGNAARGPLSTTDLHKHYNYAQKLVTGPLPLSYDELKQRTESLRTIALVGVATLGAIDLMLTSEQDLE